MEESKAHGNNIHPVNMYHNWDLNLGLLVPCAHFTPCVVFAGNCFFYFIYYLMCCKDKKFRGLKM